MEFEKGSENKYIILNNMEKNNMQYISIYNDNT